MPFKISSEKAWRILRSSKGATLTELMIGVGMISILVLGAALFAKMMTDSNIRVQQVSAIADLRAELIHLMKSPQICSCTLNPSLRSDAANPVAFQFDVNSTEHRILNIPSISRSCGTLSTSLLSSGGTLGTGLVVDGITFENLTPTGHPNEWRGQLRVVLRSTANNSVYAPILMNQYVLRDPASPDTAATIESCVGGGGGSGLPGLVYTCPPGFLMVGGSNQFGTYCIQDAGQPAANFFEAKYQCSLLRPPGFGPAKMCTRGQWSGGCLTGHSSFGATWEWFPDNDETGAFTIRRGADCVSSTAYPALTNLRSYRCCLH